jgi:hypothetical protein
MLRHFPCSLYLGSVVKGAGSRDWFLKVSRKGTCLGLKKGRGWFLLFSEALKFISKKKLTRTAYFYSLSCNLNLSQVEYHYPYPSIKVDWLAASVLPILSSVGLVDGQICRRSICTFV